MTDDEVIEEGIMLVDVFEIVMELDDDNEMLELDTIEILELDSDEVLEIGSEKVLELDEETDTTDELVIGAGSSELELLLELRYVELVELFDIGYLALLELI